MPPDIDPQRVLPTELRFLLERYPREVWPAHANLGAVARFWLQRHAMFRELGGILEGGLAAFRERGLPPAELQAWLAPRLRFFLSQLHEHHQVEDRHYFPVFRSAEPRLVKGFALLESDHETIHHALGLVAGAANDLLASLQGAADAQRPSAADRYAAASGVLVRQLARHLDDEEDLIIPLILERGEERLGI